MTTPSPEERLRRLSSNPGQPATKADIAELRSEMEIREIKLRSEMQIREIQRETRDIQLRAEMRIRELERETRQAEKRCKAIKRGSLALYAVLFVVAGVILAAPPL